MKETFYDENLRSYRRATSGTETLSPLKSLGTLQDCPRAASWITDQNTGNTTGI